MAAIISQHASADLVTTTCRDLRRASFTSTRTGSDENVLAQFGCTGNFVILPVHAYFDIFVIEKYIDMY